jgi:ketosteroid isomerase-like protein
MKLTIPLAVTVLLAALPAHGQTNQSTEANSAGSPAVTAELQGLEFKWANAVKQRDVATIDRLQADEYVFTGPGGELWTKARALETIKAGDLEIDSFKMSDIQVRRYGDTAVVTLRVDWNGNYRGADISGPQRATDVFVKRAGRWQCVASQTTRIAQP